LRESVFKLGLQLIESMVTDGIDLAKVTAGFPHRTSESRATSPAAGALVLADVCAKPGGERTAFPYRPAHLPGS
jgi:hypothetical protein